MARKTKPKRRAKRKAPTLPVSVVSDGGVEFEFADAVLEEAETVRQLAHRAVDLVVDSGCHKMLCAYVDERWAYVTRDQGMKNMTDFIEEACAGRKEVPRD